MGRRSATRPRRVEVQVLVRPVGARLEFAALLVRMLMARAGHATAASTSSSSASGALGGLLEQRVRVLVLMEE